ncbi:MULTISPECIES: hypothetical protein [unclassified Butyrivibrio]|uniref:hypothetical protein n=1 Tax=unclassified Butyrivibrio TaxID=2639466 RepID=UPI0003F4E6B6|nr:MULTISPECIES: hypothetical protein [unclassified Butyrivibrio]
MKITGFCPLIVSKDADSIVKVFEEMGFEKRHTKSDIEGGNNINYNLKDANGNRINVASSNNVPQDITAVNINVDNFQEAYDFLIGHGFVNPRGDKVTDTSSSRATLLFSPSGFAVNITEHIKD